MSQEKAQLIAPLGVMAADGITATGVITASSFSGNVVGSAKSLVNGSNVSVGVITATSFAGNLTGNIQRLADSAPNISVGVVTATSFSGNLTGSVTDLTSAPAITVGMVTATTLEGPVTGNITGNVDGDVTGNVTGNVSGLAGGLGVNYNGGWTGAGTSQVRVGVVTATTFYGDGSTLDGVSSGPVSQQTIGTTYAINVTASGSSNYTLSGTDRNGTVSGSDPTVTVEVGDTLNFVVDASGHPFYIRVSDGGANVSTPAATNQGSQSGTVSWTPNTAGTYYYQCGNHAGMIGTITVSATTTIDLSNGNLIYYTQSADTTVSFASTANGNVYFIRTDDNSGTDRTITWPDRIKWNGGTAPTLVNNARTTDAQIFLLVTRDMGVTWYGKEVVNIDPQTLSLWSWGYNQANWIGALGQNNTTNYSSPTQVGTNTNWKELAAGAETQNSGHLALKTDGTLWVTGENEYGVLGLNEPVSLRLSSPTQIPGDWTWKAGTQTTITNLVIKTNGTLWAWGKNSFAYGQGGGNLGQNNQISYSSPVQIPGTTWASLSKGSGGLTQFAIKTDGTLWVWGGLRSGSNRGRPGLNETAIYSSPKQVGTDTNWKEVGAGNATSAIKTDGTLWSWGYNKDGVLGLNQRPLPGDKYSKSSPTQVGTDTTWSKLSNGTNSTMTAIKTDGTAWAWGYNYYGLNAQNTAGPTGTISSPIQIGTATNWQQIEWQGYGAWGLRKS